MIINFYNPGLKKRMQAINDGLNRLLKHTHGKQTWQKVNNELFNWLAMTMILIFPPDNLENCLTLC